METTAITTKPTLALCLTKEERELIKISYRITKPINDSKNSEVISKIVELITMAYYETSQTEKGKDEIKLLAEALLRELRKSFAYSTIQEVEIAFHRGVRGEYGEYFGLNLVTFHKFIKSYLGSFERQEALRKQKLHEAESAAMVNQLPPVNEDALMNEACIEAFEAYKKNPKKEIIDFGNVKYHHLDKKGLIDFDNEERREIFKQAKAIAYQRGSQLPARNVHDIIAQMKGSENMDIEEIKIEARHLTLKYYFDYLISTNVELKQLINQ